MDYKQVERYIQENWEKTVRRAPKDEGTLISLPESYTVPTTGRMFQEIYYWDTFFTNLGLLRHGLTDLARGNVNCLLSLVDRFGFVPNGNRTFYLNRSQPPYLCMMVRDIYEDTQDLEWLKKAFPLLVKEYLFWMTRRMTPTGLNRHFNHATEDERFYMFWEVASRLGLEKLSAYTNAGERSALGSEYMVDCEAGCDFSPRMAGNGSAIIPIDLNAYLYLNEMLIAEFAGITGLDSPEEWRGRAARRAALINRYCYNSEKGWFMDYDFVNRRQTDVISYVGMIPMWAGLATADQAETLVKNLGYIEREFGIVTCKEGPRQFTYQWDSPNGWPPMFYLAVCSLDKYGYREDAERIARKYVDLVASNFERTGCLWEKYNVITGTTESHDEYEMPAMMGWSAGVYAFCLQYLGLDR